MSDAGGLGFPGLGMRLVLCFACASGVEPAGRHALLTARRPAGVWWWSCWRPSHKCRVAERLFPLTPYCRLRLSAAPLLFALQREPCDGAGLRLRPLPGRGTLSDLGQAGHARVRQGSGCRPELQHGLLEVTLKEASRQQPVYQDRPHQWLRDNADIVLDHYMRGIEE